MTDQRFNDEQPDFYDKKEREEGRTTEDEYMEETAAEVAPRIGVLDRDTPDISPENERPRAFERPEAVDAGEVQTAGRGMGWFALALSIISLFILPVIMGAAGIIVGFIARRRGAEGLGNWAIGIGIVSIAVNLFLAPFFF